MQVLKEINSTIPKEEKITVNTAMMRVIVEAIKACPEINSHIYFNRKLVRGEVKTFKEINISMPTNNTGIQIVANNSSDEILKLLHKERQKLRSSLAKEIANLQYRCNGNDNGNIEDLNRGGTK